MKRNRLILSFWILCFFSISIQAQEEEETVAPTIVKDSLATANFANSIFDLMYQDTLLNVRLEMEVQNFVKNKSKDIYHTASISFLDKDSLPFQMDLRVKPRGKSRREFCNFPPIKLKFDKDSLARRSLQEHNDLKLVTHCKGNIDYRNIVLKEYLVYKAFSILSKQSMRVQLVKMDYVDIENENKVESQYGLIIEDDNQMAARLGGKILDQRGLKADYIAPDQLTFIAMFQYMIGNTDWIIEKHHNLKFIKSPGASHLCLVPYDFDICGLVDATYAIPRRNVPIESVKDRIFQGKCATEEEYQKCLDIFRTHKTEIFDLFENFEELNRGSRKSMISYLNEFYKDIEKSSFVKKKINPYCKD